MPSEKNGIDVPKAEKIRKKIPKLTIIAQNRTFPVKMVHMPQQNIPLAMLKPSFLKNCLFIETPLSF